MSPKRNSPIKQWLAISLFTPKGFSEGISNFLIEQGATGIEEVDEESEGRRIKAYFPEDGKERDVLPALRRYLKSLQGIDIEMPRIRIEAFSIPEQDWGENWKRFFKPVQVTSRFVIKPPWEKIRLKKGQVSIDITPGMAFGTGTHASTQLCIRALEQRIKKRGLTILDVGTGSGILSIVAAHLGGWEVLGLDTDGVAIENARENVEQNSVSGIVKIRKGRIGSIRKWFDVVVANLDLKNLRKIRWPLTRHLKGQGFLILSGVLESEKDRLCQHYLETGFFQWVEVAQEEEWVCLTFKKKGFFVSRPEMKSSFSMVREKTMKEPFLNKVQRQCWSRFKIYFPHKGNLL
jgi:ribosomal protein L11 methyltransferase